ncbi:MAG: Gp37 family protein [Candidatus Gastranaerophilales bacterium]|nr:Gp37 family protein [Candidatus Gastranaerophilales bacterium]
MSIKDIENSIIERLKGTIQDLHIEGFPEKPAEFKLIHPKGAILVHYQGSSYSEPKSPGCIFQERKLEFSITVVMRNLRTHEGTYEYLDKVRDVLTGFKPENCGKMYPLKEDFLAEDNGLWQYGINFALTTNNIEADNDTNLVFLKRITLDDNFEERVVIE